MCPDRQESPSHEETKNANRFTSSETLNSGSTAIYGRPKAKEESLQNYDDEGASGKRSCPACGRIFNSGKALGGHKAKGKCFVNARKGFDLNSTGGDHQRHICSVCGKDFPSVMSLSGHMRAHPERDWRGIQPPPLSQKVDYDHSSFALECIVDSDIDLLKFRPNPRSNTDHRRETMESSSCALAAEGLVCLSRGSQPSLTVNDKYLANKKATLESKKSGLSVSSLKRRIDRSLFKRRGLKRSLVKACKGGSILKDRNKLTDDETGEDHEQEFFMEEQSSHRKKSTDGFAPVKTQMMKKKQKKIKKGKSWKMMMEYCSPDPEETLIMSDTDNGYICRNCGKSFVTFQALGGHRSSHTNEKKLRQLSTDSSFADASVENAKESNKTSSHHVDDQARDHDDGGHIRSCVWREVESPGEASVSAPKIELPLKAPSQSSTNIRRILDFDLNEPCDIMED